MRRQSYLSREFVEAQVSATSPGGQAMDPATLLVQFAFMADHADPSTSDWHDAQLLRGTVFGVLVGPDALVLARGRYTTWCQITDNPEKPAEPFGVIEIV